MDHGRYKGRKYAILMIILQKSLQNSGNFRVIMADMFDLLFKHGSIILYFNVPFVLKKKVLMHFDSRKPILLNIIIQYYNLMILYEVTGTPFFVTNFKTGNPMKNAALGRTVTLRLLKVGVFRSFTLNGQLTVTIYTICIQYFLERLIEHALKSLLIGVIIPHFYGFQLQ